MKQSWKSWWKSLYKQNHLIVKLGVSILLLGFGFRLLFSQSTEISDVSDSTASLLETAVKPNPSPSMDSERDTVQIPIDLDRDRVQIPITDKAEVCDIFTGEWMPYPAGATYTNETCRWIESHQNCMTNGRPDTGYLYWRWKPRDCDLPQFDAKTFLESMRNKAVALVGDSITRNHVQSLLCVLSKVEDAVELYHDKEYRNRRWQFPSYNFTVSSNFSPFLTKAAIFENYDGVSTSEIKLHLEVLDESWIDRYRSSDYVIFNSGKWHVKTAIYYENGAIIGCHYCNEKKNFTALEFNFAYRKILKYVFNFVINSGHRGTILYRTSTTDHFENGDWDTGGTCQRLQPAKEGDFELGEFNKIIHEIELQEFETAAVKASGKGVKLKLLDVTSLSLLRPDGHPGPYRNFYPFAKKTNGKVQYDCLHWCLPGPIDYWNDLLMQLLVNGI